MPFGFVKRVFTEKDSTPAHSPSGMSPEEADRMAVVAISKKTLKNALYKKVNSNES